MKKLKKSDRRRLLVVISLAILISLGGVIAVFANRQEPKVDEPTQNNGETEVPKKKLTVFDEESKTRPYAVMINNNSAVWKYQSGLNSAYIVYEMLTEGGITREMALFKDVKLDKIASVRSSRHYFLDYALENDAIYVHWGWSPQAESDIKSLKINNINGLTYEGTYFFRDYSVKGIGIEHKGYTTTEKLDAAVNRLKYRKETDSGTLLSYDVDPVDLSNVEGVIDARTVEVPYSGGYVTKFYYDEASKMYKKSQNKTEIIDYTSKERITTKNIIVYNVKYSTIDSYGRQTMANTGSGTGYFISEGKAVPITWEKKDRASKTIYKYKDGTILKVNDGRTYIGLMPTGRNVKMSA